MIDKRDWKEKVRINKSFMNSLIEQFGTNDFTNQDAYEVYVEHHRRPRSYDNWPTQDPYKDPWAQMNVRNYLNSAAYKGHLKKLGDGHYQFTPQHIQYWHGRK